MKHSTGNKNIRKDKFEIITLLVAEFYFIRNSYVDKSCNFFFFFFCVAIELIQVNSGETKDKQEQKS